ncbi:hypothetical protein ACFQ07_25050 [Actinomadura adrarensis]|uniref:Uncharacterized protein n=1 Tax=Actinomadura adrarensis TaxID=1819600 RepID=A0ABW3CMB1_9ACTN
MKQINTTMVLIAVAVAHHLDRLREEARNEGDRGSSTVETIILVAGFAGIAFTIYLAVSGKVQSWIAKIPG